MQPDFKIAVLISGGGTTLKNLLEFRRQGRLLADIVQVISSNPSANGNSFATDNSIPLEIIERSSFETTSAFSKAIFDVCKHANVNLVVMGGFLKRVRIQPEFENKVINIHPSLIPAFSGKGFYGSRVHKAVIEYGCKVSGCTVHFVDDQYDHGPIIAQRSLNIDSSETTESLAQRVFQLECQVYPEVINLLARNLISVNDRTVTIASS